MLVLVLLHLNLYNIFCLPCFQKMTSKLSAKFFEIFKNLKSDAVPRPPRQRQDELFPGDNSQAQNENVNNVNNQEEIFVEQDHKKGKKKPKYKKSFSVPNRESPEMPEDDDRRSSNESSTVNTQATGSVINIVNSNHVRCGADYVYYMGPVYGAHGQPNRSTSTYEDEEPVEKTNLIMLLLEANNKPDHDYMDYISKHLGKNWHSFFRRLGYKQGEIETAEIDMAKHGVAEARYKLLLDWIRNDADGTLGKLANVLWEAGERQIVKELAAMYNKTK